MVLSPISLYVYGTTVPLYVFVCNIATSRLYHIAIIWQSSVTPHSISCINMAEPLSLCFTFSNFVCGCTLYAVCAHVYASLKFVGCMQASWMVVAAVELYNIQGAVFVLCTM